VETRNVYKYGRYYRKNPTTESNLLPVEVTEERLGASER
jgi:hypothetical protein